MQVYYGFDLLPKFRHAVVTVGSFDGVHLGHQALIRLMRECASERGGETIVLTFEPHPRITLHRAEGLHLLTSFEEKKQLLESYGVDNLVVIPFDASFSALTGREFIEDYLVSKIGAEVLVAGFNHRFGHDRCDADHFLTSFQKVVKVGEFNFEGEKVSSTVIRNLLEKGEVKQAEKLAGHPLVDHKIENI